MNIDVCKRCLDSDVLGELRFHDDDGEGAVFFGAGDVLTIIPQVSQVHGNKLCGCCFAKVENVFNLGYDLEKSTGIFNLVELVDKDCPYYLEHFMHDNSHKRTKEDLS